LALNGLTPVLAAKHGNDILMFNFDTGQKKTSLYSAFNDRYKMKINGNFTSQTFEIGSVGGTLEFDGFTIETLIRSIADSRAALDSLSLRKNQWRYDIKYVYGNFGQNYIKQFDKMIISFKYSSVLFEYFCFMRIPVRNKKYKNRREVNQAAFYI